MKLLVWATALCLIGCASPTPLYDGPNESALCDSPQGTCTDVKRCWAGCCDDVGMDVEQCIQAVDGHGYPGFPEYLTCSRDCLEN